MRTFFGQGGIFRADVRTFWCKNFGFFLNNMVCPHVQGGRGSFFCDFVRTSFMDSSIQALVFERWRDWKFYYMMIIHHLYNWMIISYKVEELPMIKATSDDSHAFKTPLLDILHRNIGFYRPCYSSLVSFDKC